jgi:hypothetical protein
MSQVPSLLRQLKSLAAANPSLVMTSRTAVKEGTYEADLDFLRCWTKCMARIGSTGRPFLTMGRSRSSSK